MRLHVKAWHISRDIGLCKQAGKVQALGFPVFNPLLGVEQVRTANQVIKLGDTKLRHDLADLFGDKEEVIDHMLRLAGELLAQDWVLRGHANRASVQMALAHHDAALDHQRCGGKAEFVRPQKRADGDIAASLHLAVGLHANPSAQAVQHQSLLSFS